MTDDDDARLDATIVELFADKAEGWEFLTMLPDDALARLRVLQRRGKLDSMRWLTPTASPRRSGSMLRRQVGHQPLTIISAA